MISKQPLALISYVSLIAAANTALWLGVTQGSPAPRSGRIMGLIIILAAGALFSDRFSNNPYAPTFIKAGCLVAMTLLFLFLYNQ